MIGIRILFCLILMNIINGARAVGEEADNGNGKKDLLFEEMWRKAFEANRHNGKETEKKEEMPKKEVKKELKKEEEGEEEEEEEESTKRVKEEQTEEEENKLWKKVKREPIDDQLKEEEERDGEKWQKRIKKEPKIEENEWENLPETEEDNDQQQEEGSSDQSDSDQSIDDDDGKKIESETDKLTDGIKQKIIKSFDKMKEEYKLRKEYNSKTRTKIEQKIAKELGTYRRKIYKWKRELINREKKQESEKEKLEIIEKFNKMRKEYKNKKDYKNKDRHKIEKEIAKALGTHRDKIYEWKKELNRKNVSEGDEERKSDIIEKFDRMRKERTNKKGYTNGMRSKIEQKIANELYTYRDKIYRWKKERSQKKKPESEEEKWEIIEQFDKMRNEYKMKNKYNNKNYCKIEHEIAKKLGICRNKIYKWKKTLTPSRVLYTMEQKRAIIEEFDKLCEEFSNKFNRKPTKIIEEKIAKKFHVCRKSIYMWKSMQENDE